MTTIKTIRPHQGGFTLIELMIVIAIVAILLAVALPAYQNQIIRGHRAAAQSDMLDIANREQQYLLSNRAYLVGTSADTTTGMGGTGFRLSTRVAEHYTYAISVDANPVPSYIITLTAIPGDRQEKDGLPLTLDSEGNKGPAGKW
jgi:type IV pilus assembly protein PilE